ncbi:MAG: HAD-IC family P-type ATPase [Chlamydiota bacterium]
MTFPWCSTSVPSVFNMLESNKEGLKLEEAQKRLETYGLNQLPKKKPPNPIFRFLFQFHNLLIYLLLAASLLTAFLHHWVDMYVILMVVILDACIGFFQETKAENAINAIKNILALQARVKRNNTTTEINAKFLVPGDVVFLQAGDKVPADLRLFFVKGLKMEESSLTGESTSVEKNEEPVEKNTPLTDRTSMAYAGTLVTSRQSMGIVVQTGAQTELGKISHMMETVQEVKTPLIEQMEKFSRGLAFCIIMMAIISFLFGVFFRDFTLSEMFMIAVGFSVSAIPEGLPIILTVALAIGVQKMAKQNAIIRHLPAVETLGCVTVICSDKTGTLTKNEMTTQTIVTAKETFSKEIKKPLNHPSLHQILLGALLCNDAEIIQQKKDVYEFSGDPTDGALLISAIQELPHEKENWQKIDTIPFDSKHRFMASLHQSKDGESVIFIKGSPEHILDRCSSQLEEKEKPFQKEYWETKILELASKGQRVIGMAYKKDSSNKKHLHFHDVEKDLCFIGLFGLIDPPRKEVLAAIKECYSAGIRVKMITGDHAATARAIAQQIHLKNAEDVFTGQELDHLSLEKFASQVQMVDVFARTSPEHKLFLVQALQKDNEVVAMTGDGVNDAPALKQAHVGVAMGKRGTEVAKESSEMVIADDNFATIVKAVKEGRTIYDNVKKSIFFLLPINGGESLSVILAVFFNTILPITPLQILWVNLVSSFTLAMTLAFEPMEKDVMSRKPRNIQEALVSSYLLQRIGFISILFTLGIFGIFTWLRFHGASIGIARTAAVNTLVTLELFYLVSVRVLSHASFFGAHWKKSFHFFVGVGLLLLVQGIFTYAPFMQDILDTESLGWAQWKIILSIGLIGYILFEAEKWIRRVFFGKSKLRN